MILLLNSLSCNKTMKETTSKLHPRLLLTKVTKTQKALKMTVSVYHSVNIWCRVLF